MIFQINYVIPLLNLFWFALIFSVLIPDFDTNDLNTLLPWLYGDGSDEQQPNPELVKAMCVGQPQTFTKMPEGAEDMPARPTVAQYAAAVANREALLKPEIDPRINPMDANSLFQVSNENQHLKEIHSERLMFFIERKFKVRKSRKQFLVSSILPKIRTKKFDLTVPTCTGWD